MSNNKLLETKLCLSVRNSLKGRCSQPCCHICFNRAIVETNRSIVKPKQIVIDFCEYNTILLYYINLVLKVEDVDASVLLYRTDRPLACWTVQEQKNSRVLSSAVGKKTDPLV